MAPCRSQLLRCTPRRSCFSVGSANQRSTRFSQEALATRSPGPFGPKGFRDQVSRTPSGKAYSADPAAPYSTDDPSQCCAISLEATRPHLLLRHKATFRGVVLPDARPLNHLHHIVEFGDAHAYRQGLRPFLALGKFCPTRDLPSVTTVKVVRIERQGYPLPAGPQIYRRRRSASRNGLVRRP